MLQKHPQKSHYLLLCCNKSSTEPASFSDKGILHKYEKKSLKKRKTKKDPLQEDQKSKSFTEVLYMPLRH